MNRFLPLLLFAGLLSPVAAVANTHNTRDICAKYAVKEITYKQAARKLKLSNKGDMRLDFKVNGYCKAYINW